MRSGRRSRYILCRDLLMLHFFDSYLVCYGLHASPLSNVGQWLWFDSAFLHGQNTSKRSVCLGSPGHQCVSRVAAHCNPFESLVPQNVPFTKHPSLKLKRVCVVNYIIGCFCVCCFGFNIDILCIQFLFHAKWRIPNSVYCLFNACVTIQTVAAALLA